MKNDHYFEFEINDKKWILEIITHQTINVSRYLHIYPDSSHYFTFELDINSSLTSQDFIIFTNHPSIPLLVKQYILKYLQFQVFA